MDTNHGRLNQQFDEAYSEVGVNPLVDTALLVKSSDFKDRFKQNIGRLKSATISYIR